MRCSKWFNARQTRTVRDFCVSLGPEGLVGLSLLADRAENSESQATLGRSGRRQQDHFAIEMSEAEARKLYEALHRKFGMVDLVRESVQGVAQGVGAALVNRLLSPLAAIHTTPAALPAGHVDDQ